MSKLIVINHLTLDGVMQGPGRPDEDRRGGFEHGGWAGPGNDELMQHVVGEHMGTSWSLLVGRRTYEDFAAFWPNQPPNPFTEALDNVQKYVASTTLTEPLPWQHSTLLKADAAEAVAGLKTELGTNLVVMGSGELVQSLLRAGLVDQLLLMIHPLVLGTGRRLFPEGSPASTLRLVNSVTNTRGVLLATYQPDER